MFEEIKTEQTQLCRRETQLSILIAIAGSLAYFLIADPLRLFLQNDFFGYRVYDFYLRSLLAGHFDVPFRVISYEGHYSPAGKAFVYHGMAPLLPRAVAAPFVDLGTAVHTGRWVIFICTTIAIGIFHYTVFQILRHTLGASQERLRWILLTGVMCWTTTAGPLVISNASIYNETFATALIAISLAGYIFARLAIFHDDIEKWIVPLAVCAAIAIHSRSTIAFGLCLSFGFFWLFALTRTRLSRLQPLLISALVVSMSLGALLASNQMRFGDMAQMHGSLDPEREDLVQHAVVYWGLWEKRGTDYTTNFVKHGTFHIGRIPGNAFMHFFGMPAKAGPQVEIYKSMMSSFGPPRIWGPHGGVLFLWMPWFVILFFAASGRQTPWWAIRADVTAITVLGGAASAVLVLSFASLHFRYRVDLWPLFSVLSLASLALLLRSDQSPARLKRAFFLTCIAAVLATACSAFSVLRHTSSNQDLRHLNHVYGEWSYELCLEMVAEKGLPPEKHEDLCDLS